EYEADKISAYQTLYECLETITRLMAPISPFFSDAVFQNLNAITKRFNASSIHHTNFPTVNADAIDVDLETRMQLAQEICSLILSLRKKVNIKVRQPLQKVFVPALDDKMHAHIEAMEDIIKSEVNVKEVVILNANNDIIKRKAKANFKTLGKRLGKQMKLAADLIAKLDDEAISTVLEGMYTLTGVDYSFDNEDPIIIHPEDIEVTVQEIPGFEVATKGNLTVALDITITETLQKEGNAREFVNRIQTIRKESGFDLTDRINVEVLENKNLESSINDNKIYICGEILADDIAWVTQLNGGTEIEVNEILIKVTITKKG
ncbi:MAG: class I tRNA ligase family protein, partial [Bacteroidota bacterium]|nr:class I tRNA ligase family protein [Bacteroidota bacterium]